MMASESFQQSQYIPGIHNIPRFGHTNSISQLASSKRSEQEDYVRGVLAFVFFAAFVLYTWSFVLALFKFLLEPANCASGGSTLDVARLRKQKVPRDVRRRRILRSWRVQWAFLVASILIPITTLLTTRNGLKPLIQSLDEIESISDEVEAIAFRGIAIAESLQQARTKILNNFTDRNLADICTSSPPQQGNSSIFTLPVDTLTKYIDVGVKEVQGFIDEYADEATTGLQMMVGVTEGLDDSVAWIYRNDWLLKFFLLTINVVNSFFLVGVFLSKQDLVSHSYQRFLSYAMIPAFSILLIISMIASCVFCMASMVNADFCHDNMSVDGTMHDIIINSGVSQSDLTYQAFIHYMEGCFGEHPLNFVHSLDSLIKHTKGAIHLLEDRFDSLTPIQLNQHCTEDVHLLIPAIPELQSTMGDVQQQVRAVIELTGCHQINPVLRRITMGVTCSDTVDAMTWIFVGMWCITLFGFTMLSVRASLFNSVVRAPRRKRQREREKEFEEYKEYMAAFYEDAGHWQMDVHHQYFAEKVPSDKLPHIPTFETEETSQSMPSDDMDGSDLACLASPGPKSDDTSSSESSYESDYSSDSDGEGSNMSFSVLVGRMFHTRSSMDEQHSQILAMSSMSQNTHDLSLGNILELQTPMRRRKQSLPNPYNLGDYNSPKSDDSSARDLASPQSCGGRGTPQAPLKPKRSLFRTKGADKES